MTHASLFSGIGGAELAALWAGWDNVFHCEINPFCRKVLDYWFPNSKSYEDITKTDFKEWKGKVDVLTGGFPCQPFSQAGKRKGDTDDRYLWPQMLRVIREIQPTWVVGENVAGIVSMVESCEEVEMGRADDIFEENIIYRKEQEFTIERICKDFEREGYSVQPIVIPACAVGAPHRRDRVWFIAHRDNAGIESEQKRPELSDEFETIAHTKSKGRNAWRTESNRKDNNQTIRNKVFGEFGRSFKERIITDTNGNRLQRYWYEAESSHSAINPECIGRNESQFHDGEFEKTQQEKCREEQFVRTDCSQNKWRDFPTQSPVCGGNDGLPFDVDNLTISLPKWRQESIKAYGNAWVPQVAYEIFLAIEKSEKL